VPLGVPKAEIDALAALRQADELMYEAKRSGKGRGAIGLPDVAPPAVASSAA